MQHELKIWPEHYEAVECGRKKAELRVNDRDYKIGDSILLKEFEPNVGYTGKELDVLITHVCDVGNWLPGYVMISIKFYG